MAAYSMTGFAQTTAMGSGGKGFTLTLKSVNHRFLDLHFRLPAGFDALEMQVRKLLKERLRRGHVEFTLQVERGGRGGGVVMDPVVVAGFVEAYRVAAREHGLGGEPDLNTVLRLPGALTAEAVVVDAGEMEALVLAACEPLLRSLDEMRGAEGALLVEELRACMLRIDVLAGEVSGLRDSVRDAYFTRMRERIAELTAGAAVSQERILAEAAVMAERSDVDEELVRLRAHVEHFIGLLDAGGEMGKKLDFLLQELNREANTLLSKTSGAGVGNGLRITEIGLELKTEIERAREQVQNIE